MSFVTIWFLTEKKFQMPVLKKPVSKPDTYGKNSTTRNQVKKTSKNGTGTTPSNGHTYSGTGLSDDRELLTVLTEVKNGNFKVRMPIDKIGIQGKICDTLNDIISLNEEMMLEFTRAGNTIGKQGKLNQRIEVPSVKGAWSTGVGSLNALIADLVTPKTQQGEFFFWFVLFPFSLLSEIRSFSMYIPRVEH